MSYIGYWFCIIHVCYGSTMRILFTDMIHSNSTNQLLIRFLLVLTKYIKTNTMDELNTNTTPIHTDIKDISDAAIEEVLPTPEEIALEPLPMSETEVEAAVGGDEPVEGEQNFNVEDEEAEKQEPAI